MEEVTGHNEITMYDSDFRSIDVWETLLERIGADPDTEGVTIRITHWEDA